MPYDARVSDSNPSGARQDCHRLRRDGGPCASGLSRILDRGRIAPTASFSDTGPPQAPFPVSALRCRRAYPSVISERTTSTMESQQFDSITKMLGGGASRRAILGALGAGAAGAGLGVLSITGVEAGGKPCVDQTVCRRANQYCDTNTTDARGRHHCTLCPSGTAVCKSTTDACCSETGYCASPAVGQPGSVSCSPP
jgi:hypothetical protein